MNKIRNLLAAVVLLGAFVYSAWHVLGSRRSANSESERVTIRVGHWLLHAGMREAFDEAIAEYAKVRPDVSVEQIPVPIRAWPSWLRTQLVGGTAPDITGMLGANEEVASRHFLPLTDFIARPNPYNAGTPLADVPWASTFVDGMTAVRNLTPTSGDIHGVNLQLNTLRLYYNKRLLEAVTGSAEPPANYAALRALGPKVEDYNRRTGAALVPIASCGPYSQFLFERLLPSQTQRLTIELSPARTLALPPSEVAARFLTGDLSFSRTAELRSSLSLLRDVSTLMTPGYPSLQRDDALFSFLQQSSVMICAGSWDYAVFERDGAFPVGIMPVVLPSADDPEHGRFVLGIASESTGTPEATLGIVRTSKHPDIALDFLYFLSSRRIAQKFSDMSLRMSSVATVEPPARAAGLAPRLHGELPGFMPDFNSFGGNHANLVFKRNLHLLIGPAGSVDQYATRVDSELPDALRRDADLHLERLRRDVRRLDAHLGLMLTRPDADARAGWSRLSETRDLRQLERATYRTLAE